MMYVTRKILFLLLMTAAQTTQETPVEEPDLDFSDYPCC